MAITRRFSQIIALPLIIMLLAACGTPQPTSTQIPPTAIPTSSPTPPPELCDGVEGTCVEFRFVSGSCRRVGPEFVSAGETTIIYSNYTSGESGLDLEILDDGRTWMDMRRHITDGTAASQPDWSVDVGVHALLLPGGNRSIVHELTAGIYIVVCYTGVPHRIWLAEQLVVEE